MPAGLPATVLAPNMFFLSRLLPLKRISVTSSPHHPAPLLFMLLMLLPTTDVFLSILRHRRVVSSVSAADPRFRRLRLHKRQFRRRKSATDIRKIQLHSLAL